MQDRLKANLAETQRLGAWLCEDGDAQAAVRAMAAAMVESLRARGRILSCGNGGSMCDAMHFAEELTGRFHDDRPPIAAQAISDPGHLSCVANDYGYEQVFARAVGAFGRAGDVLLAFSTSGNSANVLAAARVARERGMVVCGLLGRDGGAMRPLCDQAVVIPSTSPDRVQELHIQVVHNLIEQIEGALYPAAETT
jgi:D-sedoheptulose 7-phosphate isomerase